MNFADQIDHDEIEAVTAETVREGREELLAEMEQNVATLVRAARAVPTGDLFEMTESVAKAVEKMSLNNGELAMLVGMFALAFGQPQTAGLVVERLALHFYGQVHRNTPGTSESDYLQRRWDDDAELRERYYTKARRALLVAFAV